MQSKHYTPAIEAYQKAAKLGSNDVNLYINMASAYYNSGNYNNSALCSKKALMIDGSNSKAMGNLLIVYYKTAQHNEAKTELIKYLKLYPNKRYDKNITSFVGYYKV